MVDKQLELETEIYNILTCWPNQVFTQKHKCPRLAKPRTTDKLYNSWKITDCFDY